ncbi:hypothetical protein VC83_02172 [Pseudogymnoascus destructans]|uniref:Uncharacterized protein n=1 Tax=Pseudogymnoascus destructans TaxID=655981 RepID=A0A177AHH7_9PEZI|nr:uncharacterized protein VC83_02172 [Pseudogymnoascus destructans]OAF61547.1 hypothetical protein VC83_02172 [Pseudogymnoascus destructans]
MAGPWIIYIWHTSVADRNHPGNVPPASRPFHNRFQRQKIGSPVADQTHELPSSTQARVRQARAGRAGRSRTTQDVGSQPVVMAQSSAIFTQHQSYPSSFCVLLIFKMRGQLATSQSDMPKLSTDLIEI